MRLLRLAHRYLVRQTFPSLAIPYYDSMLNAIAELYLGPFCRRVLGRFSGPITILDAGSGTGQLAVMLARRCPCCTVVGIDVSRACIHVARRRATEAGLDDRVTFVRANLERCPLAPRVADLVVSTCSLHHWRRPAKVLRELARFLRPAGEIWLMDDSADATDEARDAWVAAVEEAADVGWFFHTVFWFESRFLAYSEREVARLCQEAGLKLADFSASGVLFLARIVPGCG